MRALNRIRSLIQGKTNSTPVQMLRYGVVSVAALGTDFVVLYALTDFVGLHYLVSAIVAYTAGLVVNYALSVLWVFATRRIGSKPVEAGVFTLIGLAGLGVNELLLWLLASIAGLHYLVARVIAAGFGFLWKFFVRKFILFR